MMYTRQQLIDFLRLGVSVIVCGNVYTKEEDLPSQEQIDKCYNKLNINEKDTFLGLPTELLPVDNASIVWNGLEKKWIFTNAGTVSDATKSTKGIIQIADKIDENDEKAVTPKLLLDYLEIIMATLTCTDAAQQIRNVTDNNTQLIDQACNLINQQQQEITDAANELTKLQQNLVSKDAEILKLQSDLIAAKEQADCDANTIALLENSIMRLGAANMKLDDCLKTIENAIISVN